MTWFAPFSVPTAPGFEVDWTALDRRFEWIRAMKDTPQDRIHHAEGNVWIHTRMVAEAMAALPAFRSMLETERAMLHVSCLLHDVAKPICTREEDDGRITSKGHSTKGANVARLILWRAGVPFAIRETIVGLVRHHQVPFWLLERSDPLGLAARASHQTRCDLLALLAEADARGRTCDDQQRLLDNIALFTEYCKERECLTTPFAFPSDHARFQYFGGKQSDPTRAPHEAFRATVTVMSGFPGAGKDRWIAEHCKGLPVVSLDRIRDEIDVDPGDAQGVVVQHAREEARAYLRAGRDFVWNATNLSRRVRGMCLRLLSDYDARIRIVYVEVPEATLHAQNRARPRPVPDQVLESLLDHWDVPDPTEAHEVTCVVT